MSDHLAFWEDLRQDLQDPDFVAAHAQAAVVIHSLDELARDEDGPTTVELMTNLSAAMLHAFTSPVAAVGSWPAVQGG